MATRSFTDLHAPRHLGLAQWDEYVKPVQYTQFVATADPVPRPQTLLDFYLNGDLRQILNDADLRPDHYTDRQREVLRHLVYGTQASSPVTTKDKDDLFYQWTRQSELSSKSKELVSAISDARHRQEATENEGIIMDDGRSLAEHQQGPSSSPTFEGQDFGDKIII